MGAISTLNCQLCGGEGSIAPLLIEYLSMLGNLSRIVCLL